MLSQQQVQFLTKLPDPASMRSQVPPSVTGAMVEMNMGLQWGMNEFRYGGLRGALAKRLSELKGEDVRQAVRKHLSDSRCSAISLRPASL
jgi:hypothetical protein